ncbi:MAG: hypothetical protein JWQ00_2377, partial [Noviherbaspirillum sp.]|nr:hypothetical protein [Noviherbaspirillum sp.]
MDSDDASKTKRRPRGILIAFGALLLMLALLLAAGGWLLATESGARAAFAMAGAAARADGVHGRLIGPLRIDRLTLDSGAQRITLEGLKLEWRAAALLSRRLQIQSLRADNLVFEKKEEAEKEPSRLPDSIALPIELQVDSAELGGGEIRLGPSQSIGLGPLAFKLSYDAERYLLDVERLGLRSGAQAGSFAGTFRGQARVSTSKPYALDARFASGGEATVGERKFGATGDISARGSLEELIVGIDLAVSGASIKGRAAVRPFSEQPLGLTDLSVAALDLSRFMPALPTTRIAATLRVAPDGAGELAIANAEAGPYDEMEAPFTSLRIAFRQQEGRFDFERIAAMLGAAKQTAGTLTGSGRYAGGALTLDLTVREVNLRGLDSRMRPTALSGRIGLRQASGAQSFSVELTEPFNRQTIGLIAHGSLAGSRVTIDKADLSVGQGRLHVAGHADLEGAQGFSAAGELTRFRLKDLGAFEKLPDLLLNARFSVNGARQPQLVADLTFGIVDSRLEGHSLRGEGKATLRADSVDIARFMLEAGANRLDVQGRLSQNEGQLSFTLAAPRLDQLGPQFGGALDASGTARGSFTRPQISANWSGSAVRL